MKIRVLAIFSLKEARTFYRVERFADFDGVTKDGKKYVFSISGVFWRQVTICESKWEAKAFAKKISAIPETAPVDRVIAEYG